MEEHIHVWAEPIKSESGWIVNCKEKNCNAWWASSFKPIGGPVRIYEVINGRYMARGVSEEE